MPIPKFDELFNEVLEFLSDKKEYKTRDVKEELSKKLDLTDEERQQLLPSGTEPIIKNRIGWSISSLKKAGYVESQKWGSVNITEIGLKEHQSNPNITIEDLIKIPEYADWISGTSTGDSKNPDEGESTPEEEINEAFIQLNKKLSDVLLENILDMNPYDFEKLVLDLLLKMGYGGFRENAGFTTSKSNDGGIDGIINEDVLGLEKIAIQAKKYNPSNKIRSPLIQGFAGALVGNGLSKGVFITTSSFTPNAIDFVSNQSNLTIVLIDGKKLADLMIKYDLGTSTAHTYELKRIDSDYFNFGE